MKVLETPELQKTVAAEMCIPDPSPDKCIAVLKKENDDNRERAERSGDGGE